MIKCKHTPFLVKCAVTSGVTKPAVLPIPFAIPYKVPAKLGAKSWWLTKLVRVAAPLDPIENVINATESTGAQPVYPKAMRSRPGTTCEKRQKNFLMNVVDTTFCRTILQVKLKQYLWPMKTNIEYLYCIFYCRHHERKNIE